MLLTTEYKDNIMGDLAFVWGYIKSPDEYYSLREILTNPALQKQLLMDETLEFNFKVYKNIVLPYTFLDNDAEGVLAFGDNDPTYLLQNNEVEEFYDAIKDDAKISLENFKYLVEDCAQGLADIKNMQFRYNTGIDIPANAAQVINLYNRSTKGTLVNYSAKKNTSGFVPQETPEDTLTLILPTPVYSQNKDTMRQIEEVQQSNLKRQLMTLFDPYPDLDYRITAGNLMTTLQTIPYADIFGQEANNSLELQSNEIGFYESMNKYLKESIESYCKVTGADVDYMINHNIITGTCLEGTLEILVRFLINKTRSHCTHVPVNEFIQEDEVESNSEESTSDFKDRLEYAKDPTNPISEHIDYFNAIQSFINSCNGTVYTWSEVIIKLARWGSRKPMSLMLDWSKSETKPKYSFNLNTLTSEILDSTILVKSFDGRPYLPIGVVINSDRIPVQCSEQAANALGVQPFKHLSPMVLGLCCVQQYSVDNIEHERLVYMDLPTVISQIRDEQIVGFNFTEQNITCDLDCQMLNSNQMFLHQVQQAFNSKLKSSQIVLNNNQRYLKAYPQITREQLKEFNLFDFFMNSCRLPLDCFVQAQNPIQGLVKALAQEVIPYFSDAYTLDCSSETDISIVDSLNNYLNYYKENLELPEIVQTTQTTSLFNPSVVKEKIPAMYIFSVRVNQDAEPFNCVVAKAEEFEGCSAELNIVRDMNDFNTEKAQTKTGWLALKNILIIALDTKHQNKIYASPEDIEKIKDFCFANFNSRDLTTLLRAVDQKLQAQRK